MTKKVWRTVGCSLIIILAAQLSMNLFIADFKISIAIIFLAVFCLLTEAFPLIPVTFCSAFGVFALRVFVYWLRSGDWGGGVAAFFPETSFYICYGLLLWLYRCWGRSGDFAGPLAVLPLVFIDYAANFTELLVRLQTGAFAFKTQSGIFFVACLRTLVIWGILAVFDRYKLWLLQREHAERYRRLLLFMSRLNGEMVWMQKNAAQIETTMSTSYKLFADLKRSDAAPEFAASALSVAKDIHEIKKEYLLILRGLAEALDQEEKSDGMYLEELLALLRDFTARMAREQKKQLTMTLQCADNFYTDKHYALMSIFRNLFNNAVEAADEENVTISVTETSDSENYRFEVTDRGPGIQEDYIDEVFDAGFSTKINYATGEINRGLGLNLVQDLVESQLGGTIELESRPGFTAFTIQIPRKKLEKGVETE